MTTKEIQTYLKESEVAGIRPGLDRIRELMRRLGDPQDCVPIIHVAGTNGKGSTSAYMVSILSRAHKRIGWYSSPAVINEREKIRIIDGQRISDGRAVLSSYVRGSVYEKAMSVVIECAEEMKSDGWEAPTVYELETAGAFVCFFNEKVDIAVVEVGMGGRNDATNVIKKSLISVVTPIGLDHMQYLGSSIYQIAGEKAGILPDGGHLVTHQSGVMMGSTDPNAIRRQERNRGIILGRLKAEAEEKHADMTVVDRSELTILKMKLTGTDFTYRGTEYHTQMAGAYQPGNAALAIEVMRVLRNDAEVFEQSTAGTIWMHELTDEVICDGIASAKWPARFDVISDDPITIYDGAHNTDGAAALAQTLRKLIPDRRIYALMGVFKDKAVEDMLSSVLPLTDRIMTVRAPGDRGMSAESLAEHAKHIRPELKVECGGEDIARAFKQVSELAKADGAVMLVFGTLSLAPFIYSCFPEHGGYDAASGFNPEDSEVNEKTGDDKAAVNHEKINLSGNGESIAELLRSSGHILPQPCGGKGTCGKCMVRVTENNSTENRLACQYRVNGDVEVELPDEFNFPENDSFSHVKTPTNETSDESHANRGHGNRSQNIRSSNSYGIAIDIGTTTLAAALVRLSSGQIADRRSRINPQVEFGADVLTRIQAANEGKSESMRQAICEELLSGIETLLIRNGLGYGRLERVSISGNTTMLHLLMGYPVDGLGRHPFTPHSIDMEEKTLGDILGDVQGWPIEDSLKEVRVTILPGISAFVGADIVSGLYALDFDKKDKISILIDLGTNGELVIGNRNRMIATSVAAGPALEGGNISSGTACVRGAISEVKILNSPENGFQALINTIGSTPGHPEPPVGICGSGVIDTMAELVKNKIVDETGVLSEEYFEKGFPLAVDRSGKTISLTQDDIREIQMAKAAIRAGLELLPVHYNNCDLDVTIPESADVQEDIFRDADRVFIAGSFGEALGIEQAVIIGLIPESIAGKCEVVGNTSLAGAIRVLTDESFAVRVKSIVNNAISVNLAEEDDFQEKYIGKMSFPLAYMNDL
ncbi:MAG: DUF4445 domain-containing protein [Eubacterium sp.]|nr:DUF4445 domain-containing protein [Eubacterium sp.]